MLETKKITALLCLTAMTLCITACEGGKTGGAKTQTTTSAVEEVKTSPGKVELKTYEFPEFLEDIKLPDMLANPVYSSFDRNAYVTEPEEQPFDGYECTSVIGSVLYVFKEGKYKGLLDLNGEVIIPADTYTEITAGSYGLLVLSRDKELNSPDDHARFDDTGRVTMDPDFSYSPDNIKISERTIEAAEGTSDPAAEKKVFDIVLPNGKAAEDGAELGSWDSVEELDIGDVDTTKVFSGYYKATKDSSYYFICIDKYYNYTIFNGAYGFVRLKVGSVYGECYILDSSHYSELNKIIKSFGQSGSVKSPSKDPALDFIQIELGTDKDKTVITVSADGYCLTDSAAHGDQPMNKYFSRLDKESFVSLVLWVDQVLSEEYKQ